MYHVHNQHVLYQLEISPAINSYKTLLRIGALLKLSTCLIFFYFDLDDIQGNENWSTVFQRLILTEIDIIKIKFINKWPFKIFTFAFGLTEVYEI